MQGILFQHLPETRFAIAFSGGGDSGALVYALKHHNPLILIVDHGLRAGSACEAKSARSFAQSLGLEACILNWRPDNITTGLQNKARHARYALLGQACREHKISDLLTGHTEDDQAETVLMRMDAGTSWRGAAGIEDVSNAPLWPYLAGLRLWRPLLHKSRAELRSYLGFNNIPFVNDPSNENRNFARIRARDTLQGSPKLRADMLELSGEMRAGRRDERARLYAYLNTRGEINEAGVVSFPRSLPKQLLKLSIECASGQGNLISSQKLQGLYARIRGSENFTATLGGAQIMTQDNEVKIIRETGAVKQRFDKYPISSISNISPNIKTLWDGRWWVTVPESGYKLTPLAGQMSKLPKVLKEKALIYDAACRPTLPLLWMGKTPVCVGKSTEKADFGVNTAVSKRLYSMLS